jgi:hypothetical protein
VTSLLDGSSRRIGVYVVNLKLICEALRVFYEKLLILIAFYGPKFIKNGKFLDLNHSKDVLYANLKTAGYSGQRFIECCGKSKSLLNFEGVFNLSL